MLSCWVYIFNGYSPSFAPPAYSLSLADKREDVVDPFFHNGLPDRRLQKKDACVLEEELEQVIIYYYLYMCTDVCSISFIGNFGVLNIFPS